MYLPTYGGSAILHVLAAYPKLVAAVGIAASVALLATPLGRGNFAGQRTYASQVERQFGNGAHAQAAVDAARVRAATLARQPRAIVDPIVTDTLRACGASCLDLTSGPVRERANLLELVLFLHELDRELTGSTNAPHEE